MKAVIGGPDPANTSSYQQSVPVSAIFEVDKLSYNSICPAASRKNGLLLSKLERDNIRDKVGYSSLMEYIYWKAL